MTIQQYRHLPSFAQVATIAYHGTLEESGNKSGPAILGNGIYLECNAIGQGIPPRIPLPAPAKL
jgi:hypothetical protein